MAHKQAVSFDAHHGLYHRTCGLDTAGRKPKFWLGPDERQATLRAERIELLWTQVEKDWQGGVRKSDWLETGYLPKTERPVWDEITLAAAKRIAKGEITMPLPRKPSWSAYQYTLRLTDIQRRFNAVQFVPEEAEEDYHKVGAELVAMDARADLAAAQDTLAAVAGQFAGATLHQAFDAYTASLAKLPDRSGWYKTQSKQTNRLKENHPDMLLAQVGVDRVREMIDFWRHRPTLRGKVIAPTTARNQVIQLDMILNWLDLNEQFKWQKPRGMERLKRKILDDDYRPPQVETFTVEELTALYAHATPLVRLEMLLALNLGFKYAEIASLTLGEIHLNTAYPGVVRHNKPTGLGDWVTRFRRKTKVYGEWKLWPETVAGIEWAKANRKRPASSPSDTLLVTRSGLSLDEKTTGGNKSDKIMKSWQHLYKNVPEGRAKYLPFKFLEKTATDWIRNEYGGEVASLFTCHGKPVRSDSQLEAYSNKPFVRLFTALDALRDYLRPMFAAVADPWSVRPKTPPETLTRIKALRAEGKTLAQIAAEVGLHLTTVGKLCRKTPH